MPDEEDEDVLAFETMDEAIAAAWAMTEPGQTLTVHHPECALGDAEEGQEDDSACDCAPMFLQKGAEA